MLAAFTNSLGATSVLNIGAIPDSPDKQGRTYEDYFPGAEFITTDISENDHPRHITDDITKPQNIDRQFDLVLAMSVLEHIREPWLAAPEITKIIRPGGYLYVAMPFFYPLHEGKDFGDFWRWTPQATEILFPDLVTERTELCDTSLIAVKDRRNYWTNPKTTFTGFSMLMRRPE